MAIFFEDMAMGQIYTSPRRTITETDIVQFAGLTGDYNPVHTDDVVATIRNRPEQVSIVATGRDAPAALWPGLIVIEDSSAEWASDLFALLASKGYQVSSRSRPNVMLRRALRDR